MLRFKKPSNFLLGLTFLIAAICSTASHANAKSINKNSGYNLSSQPYQEDRKTEPELTKEQLPQSLKEWVDWTLSDYDPEKTNNPCPFMHNSYGNKKCVWPTSLKINVEKKGGNFEQSIKVYKKAWVPLIGGHKQWPQDIKVNGDKAIVIKKYNIPTILLEKGEYKISGKFLWKEIPETIKIPRETGIIELAVQNNKINTPEIDSSSNIWIRKRARTAVNIKRNMATDHLDIKVFRHIKDTIPTNVTTYLQLNVSGQHREITLDGALLDGFTPMELSSPLQSRLEKNGKLRVQIKPGQWTIQIKSRTNKPFVSLQFVKKDKQWPNSEIWTFEAQSNIRDVEIENVISIDPTQINMPNFLKRYPAYVMQNKDKMIFAQKKRGIEDSIPDKLNLERNWTLHFNGKGYTIADKINGAINKSWRMEMKPSTKLGQVSINGQPQLITKVNSKGNEGVEVRLGNINMSANSRVEGSVSKLDAIGWNHDFNQVRGTITLPPGWSVFHATGVDSISPTWVGGWELLDIFMVMVASIAILKVFGRIYGFLTIITLIFVHNELPQISYLALTITGTITLLSVLPDGKFKKLTSFIRYFAIFILIVTTVPFLKQQIRQALHPQLFNFGYDSYYGQRSYSGGYIGITSDGPMMEKAMESETDSWDEDYKDAQIQSSTPHKRKALEYSKKSRGSFISSRVSKGNIYAQQNELSMQNKLQNANVQTGFGFSTWNGRQIYLSWNGQVDAKQRLNLILLSANHNMIISFIRVVMLLLLSAVLIFTPSKLKRYSNYIKDYQRRDAINVAIAVLLTTAVMAMPTSSAFATTTDNAEQTIVTTAAKSGGKTKHMILDADLNNHQIPPENYLNKMRYKLIEKTERSPSCLPDCVNVSRTYVSANGDRLIVRQEIHVQGGKTQNTAIIPLPGITNNIWRPSSVIVNGEPVLASMFDGKHLLIPLKKGVNDVVVEGAIPNGDSSIQLKFPLASGHVASSVKGWEISGIHDNGTADNTIQLTRIAKVEKRIERTLKGKDATKEEVVTLTPTTLPPFMIVEREISLGLTWSIRNTVRRITPSSTGAVINVPLLEGEVVTTPGIKVKNKKAVLNLSGNTSQISWNSILKEKSSINLVAPSSVPWVEVWKLDIGTVWHANITGIPRVNMPSQRKHVFAWRPWPGEKVDVAITRPQGVKGAIKTIDRVDVNMVPGLRSMDVDVEFVLRSSLGTPHTITLPKDSKNHSIMINGRNHPLRIKDNKITFPLTPGKQTIKVSWTEAKGITTKLETPKIDLGVASVNIKTHVEMPRERWLLLVGGSKVKPALLMWSMIPLILLLSIGLGLIKSIPMKWYHWTLLCLGLAQTDLVPVALTVSWFLAITYRGTHPKTQNRFLFNLRQSGLILLTIIVVFCIIGGITGGLLGSPEMYVTGFSSYRNSLNWYHDLSGNILPTIWAISAPILVYRIAMLLWALWLSFSMIKWIKWGWKNYSKDGFWKEKSLSGLSDKFKKPIGAPNVTPPNNPTAKSKTSSENTLLGGTD
ncbi:MAG: hypothetical protein GY804_01310 [Alphaproteobacteria bacterium]|nr:hypothetical protein [Alphaproteobacteria bacterium]